MWYAQERLGPERIKNLYPFRSIIDKGARITLGSDFPVETLNPIAGFYAAVTRLAFDGTSPHGPEGWYAKLSCLLGYCANMLRFPDQRLTRDEALRGTLWTLQYLCASKLIGPLLGITIDPAWASFTEKDLGSLEVGKRADFVVLSQDIMKVPVEQLMNTKVLATALDGEVVYGDITA